MKGFTKRWIVGFLAALLMVGFMALPVVAQEGNHADSLSASTPLAAEGAEASNGASGLPQESVPGVESVASSLPQSGIQGGSEISSLPQSNSSGGSAVSSLPQSGVNSGSGAGQSQPTQSGEENGPEDDSLPENGLLAAAPSPMALGDTTAPVLKSVKVLTPRVSSPGTLRVELDLVEDGNGVSDIHVGLQYRLSNGRTETRYVYWYATNGGQTPLMTGKNTVEFVLDGSFVMTEYQISSITMVDAMINHASYSAPLEGGVITELVDYSDMDHLVKIPCVGKLVVTSSQVNDLVSPTLKSVKVLTPQVSSPGTLQVELDLVEDGSGVSDIHVGLRYRLSNGRTETRYVYWSATNEGQTPLRTGKYTVEFVLGGSFVMAEYQISSIVVSDAVANLTVYSAHTEEDVITELVNDSDGDYLVKIPCEGLLTVTSSQVNDLVSPVLNSVAVATPELQAPGLLKVELDFVEEDSGISGIHVGLRYNMGNGRKGTRYLYWYAQSSEQQMKTGKHVVGFPIDPTFLAREYQITSVSLVDGADNISTYSAPYDMETITELVDYANMDALVKVPVNGKLTVQNENKVEVISTTHDPALLDKINAMPAGGMAVVDYSYNSTASSSLFSAIAGQDKTLLFQKDGMMWLFRGTDIDPAKCKDINLDVSNYTTDGSMYGYESEETVFVMDFPDNGELPGTAYIRVYTEYLLAKYQNGAKNIFVTWFENGEPVSKTVPTELQGDNYVVFPLTHNSTFVLSATFPQNALNTPSDILPGVQPPVTETRPGAVGGGTSSSSGTPAGTPGTTPATTPATTPKSPQTGDDGTQAIWLVLGGVFAMLAAVAIVKKKRKAYDE